jgi:transcription initiation factor IIE alpha subunit
MCAFFLFTPMITVGNVIIEIVLERAEVTGEEIAREGRLEKFKVLSVAAI